MQYRSGKSNLYNINNIMEEIILTKLVVTNNRVDYYFNLSKRIQKYFSNRNHFFV